MTYVLPPDLQVVHFFICPIIENFEKVFMRSFAVGYILIYRNIIISNAIDKMAINLEFKVVEGWST